MIFFLGSWPSAVFAGAAKKTIAVRSKKEILKSFIRQQMCFESIESPNYLEICFSWPEANEKTVKKTQSEAN